MKGLEFKNNALYFNDTLISDSFTNSKGLEVDSSRNLRFNGTLISSGGNNAKGFEVNNNSLYFDGVSVSEAPEPINELSPEGYWIPPTQPNAVVEKDWTNAQYLAAYDALMAQHPTYITKIRYEVGGVPVLTDNGSYEMFSYIFEPQNYTKTFFISCRVHGNEMDCSVTLYRIMEAICNKTNIDGYRTLNALRDNVRFVIIPNVSPYGVDNKAMNVPYPNAQYGINMNRQYDFNQQYALASAGVGGNEPWEMAATRHVRDVVNEIGAENIDYYTDWHDGGGVLQHYWIDYSVDAENRQPTMDFVNYLINKYNIQNPVIDSCKDNRITGFASGYASKTLGITGGTVEWMGGYLGYTFNESQMTQSMEIRANCLWMAYKNNWSGWKINEPSNANYFHFDYPKAFTKNGLRMQNASYSLNDKDAVFYQRWDDLQTENPTKITKSAVLGYNAYGTLPIHTYTIGSGSNKVLYVGGVMRYGGTHHIDEYAIYQLAEYLCNDYIVNQSTFLQDLRDNYTIIVLPFIDNYAGNTGDEARASGINNTVLSRQRWEIVADKAQPVAGINGADNHAVKIVKDLIDDNTDLKCIVSGGEIMTGYSGNNQSEYSINYQTQFVIPRKMTSDLAAYKTHLETNRNELVVVENTQGLTFGDYAYDNFSIPTYFVQQKVSNRFTELSAYHNYSEEEYLHHNYEVGRRIANIVNLFTK